MREQSSNKAATSHLEVQPQKTGLYHSEIDPPESAPEEMAPVALIPLCLLIIATSGFGGGGKKKTN